MLKQLIMELFEVVCCIRWMSHNGNSSSVCNYKICVWLCYVCNKIVLFLVRNKTKKLLFCFLCLFFFFFPFLFSLKDREEKKKEGNKWITQIMQFISSDKNGTSFFSKIQLKLLISPDNKCDCKWLSGKQPCFILQFHVFKNLC